MSSSSSRVNTITHDVTNTLNPSSQVHIRVSVRNEPFDLQYPRDVAEAIEADSNLRLNTYVCPAGSEAENTTDILTDRTDRAAWIQDCKCKRGYKCMLAAAAACTAGGVCPAAQCDYDNLNKNGEPMRCRGQPDFQGPGGSIIPSATGSQCVSGITCTPPVSCRSIRCEVCPVGTFKGELNRDTACDNCETVLGVSHLTTWATA